MPNLRALGILALLALVAGAVWLLGGGSSSDAPTGVQVEATDGNAAKGIADTRATALEDGDSAGAGNAARSAVETPDPVELASGPVVVGQIVASDGVPLADAEVAARAAGSFNGLQMLGSDPLAAIEAARKHARNQVTGTTDADGRFRLQVPGSTESILVQARARGHVVASKSVLRASDSDTDAGTITLQSGAIVSGRVVDRQGAGVAEARVARTDRNQFDWMEDLAEFESLVANPGGLWNDDVETDAEGRFELAFVKPGPFELRARHIDHPTVKTKGLEVAAGGSLENLIILVEPGASIRGRVTGVPRDVKALRVTASEKREGGGHDGSNFVFSFDGLDGGAISLGGGGGRRRAPVEPDGTFAIRGLEVGKVYQVAASQTGRGFLGSNCSEQLEVASGANGVELHYETGISVTFQVIDDRTGQPIEKLWVTDRLQGESNDIGMFFAGVMPSSKHDEYPDGRVTLANLRPKPKQTLTLGLQALGHSGYEREGIELPTSGALDLGTIRLSGSPTLRVIAAEFGSGLLIAGAKVEVRGVQPSGNAGGMRAQMVRQFGRSGVGPTSAITDENGICEVNAPLGSRCIVSVTHDEHAAYLSGEFEAPNGRTSDHHAELHRGGKVVTRALDAEGNAIAKARIEHRGPDDARDTRNANEDGDANFEHLAPGTHRFRIAKSRRGGPMVRFGGEGQGAEPEDRDWQEVAVTDDADLAIVLSKQAAAGLSGIVRENGRPLERASVSLIEGRDEGGGRADAAAAFLGELALMEASARSIGRGRTDGEGAYTLADLPAGEHRLRITHSSRAMPVEIPVVLRVGSNTLDVELDTTILRGTVRDASGAPVAGARLEVAVVKDPGPVAGGSGADGVLLDMAGGFEAFRPSSSRARSAADGTYELRGVQPDVPLQVRASAKGHSTASGLPVRAARGATINGVDVALGAAGSIRVRTTIEGSFLMVNATFAGESEDRVDPTMQMLRDGTATLSGLRPGRWTVTLRGQDVPEMAPRTVEVVAGSTVDVQF